MAAMMIRTTPAGRMAGAARTTAPAATRPATFARAMAAAQPSTGRNPVSLSAAPGRIRAAAPWARAAAPSPAALLGRRGGAVCRSTADDTGGYDLGLEPIVVLEDDEGRPLECVMRRQFAMADGTEMCLMMPLDAPVNILQGDMGLESDLEDLTDDALLPLLPYAASALAQRSLRLQRTAYVLTIRGALFFDEADIVTLDTFDDPGDEGEDQDMIEVSTFEAEDGNEYVIYSPIDPLIFVGAKKGERWTLCVDDDTVMQPECVKALEEERDLLEEEWGPLE